MREPESGDGDDNGNDSLPVARTVSLCSIWESRKDNPQNKNPSPSSVASYVVHVASNRGGEKSPESPSGGGSREEGGGSESKLSSLVPATAESLRQLMLPVETREGNAREVVVDTREKTSLGNTQSKSSGEKSSATMD